MTSSPRRRWMLFKTCAWILSVVAIMLVAYLLPVAAAREALDNSQLDVDAVAGADDLTPIPLNLYLPAVGMPDTPVPPTLAVEWREQEFSCWNFPHASHDNYEQRCAEDDSTYEIQRKNVSYTQAWAEFDWPGTRIAFEVDAKLVQGSANYQVFFNNRFYAGFYSFAINPVDQTYSLWRVDDETTWVPLVDWTHSDHINRGDAVNRLRVERHGNLIIVSVNGQQLATVDDSTYLGSYWGLYTRNTQAGSVIHFIKIKAERHISAYPTPRPTNTPTATSTPMPLPTSTPTRTPGPTATWAVDTSLADYFQEYDDDESSVQHLGDGAFKFTQHVVGASELSSSIYHSEHSEWTFGTSIKLDSGNARAFFVFDGGETYEPGVRSRFYAFGIDPIAGTFGFGRYLQIDPPVEERYWAYYPFTNWETSPHVKRDNSVNLLRAERAFDEMRFYLNDELVLIVNMGLLPRTEGPFLGLIGDASVAGSALIFDDLYMHWRE